MWTIRIDTICSHVLFETREESVLRRAVRFLTNKMGYDVVVGYEGGRR